MIEVSISKREIRATDMESGRSTTRPNTLIHDRYVFGSAENAEKLLSEILGEVQGGWKLIKPKVTVVICYKLSGGITGVDERVVREPFEAHCREVTIDWAE